MRAKCNCGWEPEALGENAVWDEVEQHVEQSAECRVTVRPRIEGAV
jgi:hypothetical protein